MISEAAKYRLSVYQSRELIKETRDCHVEMVFCTLDEKIYIQRTYPEDKRVLFSALEKIEDVHIPRIVEVIFDENTTVVEEYIQGNRLNELIEDSQITRKQAHKLAKQIFEALDALHNCDIIHRDIKPDNILVDKNENLWLIDFGIARLYDDTARHDTEHLGTIGYAPPEQFGFSQSDFRSDLYAAGMTIEEMCKSAGCSPNSTVMKTAQRCREFDPNRRYTSANAALLDMKQKYRLPKVVTASAALILVMLIMSNSQLWHKNLVAQSDGNPSTASNNSRDNIEPEVEWVDILDNYTGQDLKTILISNTSNESFSSISLMEGQDEISLLCKLSDGLLTLTLDDHMLPEQKFIFSYEDSYEFDYADTKIDAEIVFYDMNGDGQSELLVALSDRIIIKGVNDAVICNTNWRAVWCIGYTQSEGFWQADGMMVAYGNHGEISINYLGARDLYAHDTYACLRLVERNLQETT